MLRHSDDLIELGNGFANACTKLLILAGWAAHLRDRALDPLKRTFYPV
jgi:hypothetical protein